MIRSITLLLLFFGAGCSSGFPPTPTPIYPRTRLVTHKEFSVGAFSFTTLEGEKNDLARAVPAMLLTELREIGRFSVFEGGNMRQIEKSQGEPALHEGNAKEYVDAYLSGTITSIGRDQACFDVRLANAITHEVLYARSACVPMAGDRIGAPPRDAMKRIASELSKSIKQIGYGQVTSADGKLILCNKGRSAGVVRGMVGYVVGSGDSIVQSTVHRAVQDFTQVAAVDGAQAAAVITGELYVLSVEEEYSVAVLYKGDYAVPGDTVFFK